MQSTESIEDVYQRARIRFDRSVAGVQSERDLNLKDRRFCKVAGAQWEGDLNEQFENRPKMEFNKIQASVKRVVSEYRNNRITVDFTDKNSKDTDIDDLCDGLYRSDEQDSNAEEAYDNCFAEGVQGGIGAFRFVDVYEEEESETDMKQRIEIEPIFDADSCVFWDLDSKRADKRDAKFAFVLTAMTRDAFIAEYDENPTSWPKSITQAYFDWTSNDDVYVAECYEIVIESEKVFTYKHINDEVERFTETQFKAKPELQGELEAMGSVIESERSKKKQRVKKYVMSGGGIVLDEGYISGKFIPIAMFYAERDIIDGIERAYGIPRFSVDSQRLVNMMNSRLVEMASLSPIEKPIMTDEQMIGHEDEWANDNIKNQPVLTVNQLTDAEGNNLPSGPVGFTKVPQMPPALGAVLQIASTGLTELLGDHAANEKIQGNVSGVAADMIHNKFDMQSFIYMSNFRKTMKMAGDIWLYKAQDLYVETDRDMKIVRDNDMSEKVTIRSPSIDDNGEFYYENDLSEASMSVVANVSPSTSSKKASTVKSLSGLLAYTEDPQDRSVIIASITKNMEGEGLKPMQEYYRKKLVQAGVEEPTDLDMEKAKEEAENTPPDPNAQLLESAANEANANAEKAKADSMKVMEEAKLTAAKTENTQASTEKIGAETIETLSGIERDDFTAATQRMETVATEQPTLNA